MAIWDRKKVSPTMVNSGKQYVNKVDSPSADDFNAAENNAFYAVDFAEALADPPDISEAGNIGTPSVTLVENIKIVNGEAITYKKFKFKNMKGEQGEDGGSSGSSTVTFTQAGTRANIVSGETLAVLMGKVKKWFADLKALAFKSSLAYSEVTGTPTLGTLASKSSLDYSELTSKPTLGTVASKNTGTTQGTIPLLGVNGKLSINTIPTGTVQNTVPVIGAGGKIGRYLVPNADGNLLGTVAGLPFANATTKAGATYAQILIGDAGDAYAYYPEIDTAMSDSSINLVQNKIVKAYVDTAESSAKAYVDGLVGDIETLLAGV